MKVVIYGTGTIATEIFYHFSDEIEVVAFMETNPEKELFLGIKVLGVNDVNKIQFDYIVIASTYNHEIVNELSARGVANEKIKDYWGKYQFLTDDRIALLRQVAGEINECNISGNVAELGVFKGEYAKYINKAFPNRKLYLFDTFSGFDIRDVQYEEKMSFSNAKKGELTFENEEYVIGKMEYPENCIVKKGYFPESLNGLEDEFCFVSIDVDLFTAITNGLEYFYPRLVNGGYIFIHDYNNPKFSGTKKAVREFCAKNAIPYLPFCDYGGSVILMK